jgi:hypothetical protein
MSNYSKYDTFKAWMLDNHDHEDWLNINQSGCENGISGLIYYYETNELYDTFSDEMHDILSEYQNMTGEMPSYIIKHLDNATSFKNAVTWFVAEWYADEYMTNWQTKQDEVIA